MKRLVEIFEAIRRNEKVDGILKEYGSQIKKIAVVSVMIIIGLIVYGVGSVDDKEITAVDEGGGSSVSESAQNIFVDIGGAVNNPMLAELPDGSRVEDAIKAAGGLTADADISSINRAEFLEDGSKIYIPAFARDEEGNVITEGNSGNSGISSSGKININSADSDVLQTLTGVGPVTAEKIIQYRESNGRFSSTEDLKNVSGIGDKTFEKLKDYITI